MRYQSLNFTFFFVVRMVQHDALRVDRDSLCCLVISWSPRFYGVPTPPKINFGTRHSNLTFNIQLTNSTSNLSSQHPTLALNIQSLNELPVSINDVELAMICIFRLQVWTFQRHAKTRPRTVFEFEHVSILKIDTGEMYIAHTALSVEPAIIKPLRNADFVLKCWLRFETFTSFWDVYFVLRCWLRFKMLTSFWDVDFVLRCWLRFEMFTSFWDVDFVLICWLRFEMLTSFWERRAMSAKKYHMSKCYVTSEKDWVWSSVKNSQREVKLVAWQVTSNYCDL